MIKKAIIYDLDNTIYPVKAIGDRLFASLFELITESGFQGEEMNAIKEDVMRKPFQVVAEHFAFSTELTRKGVELLRNLTYDHAIDPFEDYEEIKKLKLDRYLVTMGFVKLQHNKIVKLGIDQDFREIHIVDPETSRLTKKDVFLDIMQRNQYMIPEVLVVGDDLNSEIKAAQELGIDAVLYDKLNLYHKEHSAYRISDFKELAALISRGS